MTQKDNQISIKNVDPELKKAAQKKAIDEGRPLSEVIRELLEKYAGKQKQPAK